MTYIWRVARVVFWLVTDVWARVGWFGYTFCVGLPRGSRVVPVSAAWLRASFGWLFPFHLGGTFIEAHEGVITEWMIEYFPSIWEGLSLRPSKEELYESAEKHFPSIWEGLSLRPRQSRSTAQSNQISLPFGRDFH